MHFNFLHSSSGTSGNFHLLVTEPELIKDGFQSLSNRINITEIRYPIPLRTVSVHVPSPTLHAYPGVYIKSRVKAHVQTCTAGRRHLSCTRTPDSTRAVLFTAIHCKRDIPQAKTPLYQNTLALPQKDLEKNIIRHLIIQKIFYVD